jgi:hypothetical protein
LKNQLSRAFVIQVLKWLMLAARFAHGAEEVADDKIGDLTRDHSEDHAEYNHFAQANPIKLQRSPAQNEYGARQYDAADVVPEKCRGGMSPPRHVASPIMSSP